jgi:hypothetical protein
MTWKPQPQESPKRGIAAATLERLEAERQARIQAKIDAGKAVRDRFPIVVGIRDPKRDHAAVYLDADGVEHHPPKDCSLIITGVPRLGRDDGLEVPTSSATPSWVVETKPVERKAPPLPQPSPELPVEGPRHSIRCTVRPPNPETNDPGQLIEGAYSLSETTLRVYDNEARLLTTDRLQPGDDAAHAARRILKERHGKHSAFHDPIRRHVHVV